jgi:hypothetical protein
MWRKRMSPSWRDILNLGLSQDLAAKIGAQKTRRVQVDLAPKDLRQLSFQREEPEAWYVIRLELDQNINVAIRPKVIAKHRPEQGKPADMVVPAEVGKPFPIDCDAAPCHGQPAFPER